MNVNTLLTKSIEFQTVKKDLNEAAAENAVLVNLVFDALTLFEKRFDSDPSQFAPGEFEWYTHAAIAMSQRYGRAHIAQKVAEAKFQSIMGEL